MSIVKATSLDLNKVTFSDVKTDMHGRKMVYINNNGGKILVQTPKMYASNGIKRWRKKDALDNKEDKFEMELSFYGEQGTDRNSEEIRSFHEKLQEFDELVKNKVISHSKDWLSMPKLDKTTLESVMYTPMVKVPKDKEGNELPYPSRVKVKIDRDTDSSGNFSGKFVSNKKFKTEVMVFDENKERVHLNEDNAEVVVSKGTQVICIMELVYLSLSKTTISTKWKLVQAKVFRNKEAITEYAMLDDESEKTDLDELDHQQVNVSEEVELDNAELSSEEEEEVVVEVKKPRGRVTKKGSALNL